MHVLMEGEVVTEMKPPPEEPELQRSELEGATSTVIVLVVITQQGMASPCWAKCILFSVLCTAWLVAVCDHRTGTVLNGNGYAGFLKRRHVQQCGSWV